MKPEIDIRKANWIVLDSDGTLIELKPEEEFKILI